jgi:hypothetical protein
MYKIPSRQSKLVQKSRQLEDGHRSRPFSLIFDGI